MGAKKHKNDLLHEISGGRLVGGALSQLANYSDLFSRMAEGVFLLDRHSLRIMECNPAACALLGLTEDQILGKNLAQIMKFSSEEKITLEAELARFQKDKSFKFKHELEWQNRKGDHFFFEVMANTLKILDYIEVIQFIAKDVTEVKRAQIKLQEANAVLHKLSTTDGMTGLRNFRYFKDVLAATHDESMKFKKQYGVIFIDVDHFKKFNDRNGHPAGDEVLKGVAKILKETVRSHDLPCRYGGEEFVVLCPNSGPAEVRQLAELIRSSIASTAFPFGEFQPLGCVTASIGLANYPENAENYEDLLQKSDQALYDSKVNGRNQVTAYGDSKSGSDGTSGTQKKSA